ncbi:hypothetical protein Ciccas_011781 [Cichlidogyrus casuarinus]|uniref:Uncharacterized protein n=1 Tax=Cichlidogyrus casuarinus TaxID=1844966 RepID=A0ABD2PQY7_9PLAT
MSAEVQINVNGHSKTDLDLNKESVKSECCYQIDRLSPEILAESVEKSIPYTTVHTFVATSWKPGYRI